MEGADEALQIKANVFNSFRNAGLSLERSARVFM